MYDVYWYGANLGSNDTLSEACVSLYHNFKCTGIALIPGEVASWTKDGSGIKKNGLWLNTLDMLHCGKRLSELWNTYEFCNSDRFRKDSVLGIRKWRGGSGYYRRVRTMAERRQNLTVVDDEGSLLVRARRTHLPNSWDDIGRTMQRSWKAQHHGRKAWDKRA